MRLTNQFSQALQLAHRLHQNQTRKSGKVPYVSHLMGVSAIVLRYGGTEEEAIAALLHDAVEDQGGQKTLEMIRNQFGDTIAHIVDGCSDSNTTPKPPWKERKLNYIAHLRTTDENTLIVAASDKLYNAEDCIRTYAEIGEGLWDMFTPPREDTKWYYHSLAEVFETRKKEFPRLMPLINETIRIIDQLVALP